MRLRIQTLPPLQELKVWFVPRPTSVSLPLVTITELKRDLCRDIRQLQSGGIQHDGIRLLLDGFELLGDLPYTEVLRDGDLVCIQVLNKPRLDIEVSKKRRATEYAEDLEGARKKRKKSVETKTSGRRKPQLASSSSSYESAESSSPSSESSSESDDQASESSESTSSYGSTSSSTSSSSVSSSPTPPPSKLRKNKTSDRTTTAPAVAPVPPGYGKPSTKSRNRRRRLKRKFEKEEKEAELTPPQGVSDANLTPLGPARVEQSSKDTKQAPELNGRSAPESRTSRSQNRSASTPGTTLDNSNGEIMMASLRNKNKKKNFRQTMVAPTVRKIVFDDSGEEQPANTTALTSTQDSDSAGTTIQKNSESAESSNKSPLVSNLQTRVIPPSELAAQGLLPSNMLVTSVEFGRNTKKKKQRLSRDPYEEVDSELQRAHWLGYGKDGVMDDPDDADVYLPYDEDGDITGDTVEGSSNAQFDWKAAESRWEHFPPIETQDQLYSGVLVCWQGLAINPQTFTPEHLLGVGRVEKVEGTSITIRQILRPGTETTVAFGIANQSEDGEGEEEEYSWGDISSLGWKIVNLVPAQ